VTAWTPPTSGRLELVQCGEWWDAVKVPAYIGKGALGRLGDESGAVIEDPLGRSLYWLVEPGRADTWELHRVEPLGAASYVAVPPAGRTEGPGVRWIVPLAPLRYLTAPEALYAALAAELAVWTGPRPQAGS
jgi:hypothetical protein